MTKRALISVWNKDKLVEFATELTEKYGYEIVATGSVVIPSSYNGCPVTEIALSAFQNCSKVKSITVPDSVEKIGKKAFAGCTLLEEVSFGKGVENIGADVSRFKSKLKLSTTVNNAHSHSISSL